jgi:hypothetical protein
MSAAHPALHTAELSPEEQQKRAERCYALQETVKAGLVAGRTALWQMARALHEFDQEQGWLALGYDALGDWLADPDIGISKSAYYRLTKNWRGLAVKRRVPEDQILELEPSKVDIVLPRVESGEITLERALKDVRALGYRDLRDQYIGRRNESSGAQTPGDVIDAVAIDPDPDPQAEAPEPVAAPELTPEEALAVAQDDWEQLRDVLMEGVASGATNPRIPAALIQAGVKGADLLLGSFDG